MPQTCEHLAASGAARPPLLPMDPSQFQRWLTVAALGLLVVEPAGLSPYATPQTRPWYYPEGWKI